MSSSLIHILFKQDILFITKYSIKNNDKIGLLILTCLFHQLPEEQCFLRERETDREKESDLRTK